MIRDQSLVFDKIPAIGKVKPYISVTYGFGISDGYSGKYHGSKKHEE
jgi:hypothetical protein